MGDDGQEELGPSVGTVTKHRRERDAIEGKLDVIEAMMQLKKKEIKRKLKM